jgi:hypothetical protein
MLTWSAPNSLHPLLPPRFQIPTVLQRHRHSCHKIPEIDKIHVRQCQQTTATIALAHLLLLHLRLALQPMSTQGVLYLLALH